MAVGSGASALEKAGGPEDQGTGADAAGELGLGTAVGDEPPGLFVGDGGESAGDAAGDKEEVQLFGAVGEGHVRADAESAGGGAFAGDDILGLGDESDSGSHHASEEVVGTEGIECGELGIDEDGDLFGSHAELGLGGVDGGVVGVGGGGLGRSGAGTGGGEREEADQVAAREGMVFHGHQH